MAEGNLTISDIAGITGRLGNVAPGDPQKAAEAKKRFTEPRGEDVIVQPAEDSSSVNGGLPPRRLITDSQKPSPAVNAFDIANFLLPEEVSA